MSPTIFIAVQRHLRSLRQGASSQERTARRHHAMKRLVARRERRAAHR